MCRGPGCAWSTPDARVRRETKGHRYGAVQSKVRLSAEKPGWVRSQGGWEVDSGPVRVVTQERQGEQCPVCEAHFWGCEDILDG